MIEQDLGQVTVTRKVQKSTARVAINCEATPPSIQILRKKMILKDDAVSETSTRPDDFAFGDVQATTFTINGKDITGLDVYLWIRSLCDSRDPITPDDIPAV